MSIFNVTIDMFREQGLLDKADANYEERIPKDHSDGREIYLLRICCLKGTQYRAGRMVR